MQKVKVHRYVSGKRPEYAPASSSDEESEDEDFLEMQKQKDPSPQPDDYTSQHESILATDDPRLKRLISRKVYEAEQPEDLEEKVRRRYRTY
jgi:microfibrillar-associated protein 1